MSVFVPLPDLPGAPLSEPRQQRIKLKKKLLKCFGLPDSESLLLASDAIHSELILHLWLRVWLFSDPDLYFFLYRIQGEGTTSLESSELDLSRESTTASAEENLLLEVKREICRVSSVQNERTSILLARKALISQLDDVTFARELLIWVDSRAAEFTDRYRSNQPLPSIVLEKSRALLCGSLVSTARLGEGVGILERTEAFGRGLVATKDLQAGSLIATIAETEVISVYTALLCSRYEAPDASKVEDGVLFAPSFSLVIAFLMGGRLDVDDSMKAWGDLPWILTSLTADSENAPSGLVVDEEFVLILFVLWELKKGPESRFWNYLSSLPGALLDSSLPPQFDNLLTGPPEVAQFLDLSEITESLAMAQDVIDRMHEWLRELLPRLVPTLMSEKDFHEDGWFARSRLLWGYWLAETREFELLRAEPPLEFQDVAQPLNSRPLKDVLFEAPCDQATPLVPIIPQLNMVSANTLNASRQNERLVSLPVVIGWVPVAVAERIGGKAFRPVEKIINFRLNESTGIIAPLLDLFNHSPAAQCELPVLVTSEKGPRMIEIRNGFGVNQGAQLYISYGAHDVWSLLRFYGFCSSKESFSDALPLVFEPASDSSFEADSKKFSLLQNLRVPMEHLLHKTDYSEGELNNMSYAEAINKTGYRSIMMCLRICLATELPNERYDEDSFLRASDIELERRCLETVAEVLDDLSVKAREKSSRLELWVEDKPEWVDRWGSRILTVVNSRKSLIAYHQTILKRLREKQLEIFLSSK